MTRHLLKLIWNRKRTNLLLMIEIFFSFLVLFGIVTLGLFSLDNYRSPLGYAYQDVWRIEVDMKTVGPVKDAAAAETARQLFLAVRDLPEVAAVAGSFTGPYDPAGWRSEYDLDGRHYAYEMNDVTDGFKDVMGLELLQGRWFSSEDDAPVFKPVVVNERFARFLFGGEDPVGRSIPQDKGSDGQPRTEMRVIGVIREFRQNGEFSAPANYVFQRHRLDRLETPTESPSRLLLIKVRRGTTMAFEERLMARLQAVAREWSFKVGSLAELREWNHRFRLAPVLALALVAGFLLIMVALGLTGVLWQNVTQRTQEIGLRRAKGATAGRIHSQILGEVAIMTSMALALGISLVIQLPFLDLLGSVSTRVYAASLAISVASIYVLALACGFYPSRLATRMTPAEALHYE